MIILQMINEICCEQDYCSNKCPFYDDDVNVGTCLFSYDACDWDLERIEKTIDDTKIFDRFYKILNQKLLDVMHCKRGEEDETKKNNNAWY